MKVKFTWKNSSTHFLEYAGTKSVLQTDTQTDGDGDSSILQNFVYGKPKKKLTLIYDREP